MAYRLVFSQSSNPSFFAMSVISSELASWLRIPISMM
ncbi:hypothetical protein BCEN4_740176 [Burkholderia cenocepacia]|nr:hypothetical protein BCEN4_740176 [Burkholderia cenocepacia]